MFYFMNVECSLVNYVIFRELCDQKVIIISDAI